MIAALHPTFGFIETDAAVGWLRPGKHVFFYGSELQSKKAPVVGMPVWFELALNERLEGRRVCARRALGKATSHLAVGHGLRADIVGQEVEALPGASSSRSSTP